MAYDVTVRNLERRFTAVVRFRAGAGEMGELMPGVYGEVWAYLQRIGVTPQGPAFARFLQVGDAFDVEAGFCVPAPVTGEGRVEPGELPAGEAAATVHLGPYDALLPAYEAIEAWMRSHNRTAAGAAWEEYWTDPQSTPVEQWRTDIVWPLAAA